MKLALRVSVFKRARRYVLGDWLRESQRAAHLRSDYRTLCILSFSTLLVYWISGAIETNPRGCVRVMVGKYESDELQAIGSPWQQVVWHL